MDQHEPNPIKPTKRFRLKTLFQFLVVVGVPLGLYFYWDDWKRHRPPYQEYAKEEYQAVCMEFFDDLAAGRLDHAYDATSARFKKQMSRSEFHTTVGRFLALTHIEEGVMGQLSGPSSSDNVLSRNWCFSSRAAKGPDKKVTEFCIWVRTEWSEDSFFYRRPPPPRVEEIQVREISEAEWENSDVPSPSWEQE
jgi:hypothetical protein